MGLGTLSPARATGHAEGQVTHAHTWASNSAVYRFCSLSSTVTPMQILTITLILTNPEPNHYLNPNLIYAASRFADHLTGRY